MLPYDEYLSEVRRRLYEGLRLRVERPNRIVAELRREGALWHRPSGSWLLPTPESLRRMLDLLEEVAFADGVYTLEGDTYPLRDEIRAAGGIYNGNRGWTFTSEAAFRKMEAVVKRREARRQVSLRNLTDEQLRDRRLYRDTDGRIHAFTPEPSY